MKKIYLIYLIFVAVSLNAQDSKRGYKNLEKREYEKAKDAFAKNLEDNRTSVAANFGMALVLADDQSPLFDIIDSWQYIAAIQGRLGELTQEEIEMIGEYFMNTEERRTSRPVKKKMEIAMEAIEARLIKYVREENNLDAVYEVLERYPDYRHYDNVVHIRNQFEFRKYERQNTLAGYREFLEKFPDAAQRAKAERYIDRLSFEEIKSKNDVDAYNDYIMTFPESEYVQTAIRLRNAKAYQMAKTANTLEAYEEFIETYPNALEIADARTQQQNLLYEKAKRIKSLQAFNEFIDKYPDGQYFVDIFNLKAAELGAKFASDHGLANPSLNWVRGFDNNDRIEEGGSIAVSQTGEIILAGNTRDADTAYADAWVIKLDPNGKMLWNKTIGQPFEDSVKSVILDSKGNIYVAGYTYMSADSLSKMGWMFKLGPDGSKIWNKTLGKLDLASVTIDQTDRIFIGTSRAKDTLGGQYTVAIFNTDARKIAERTYTGRGTVNDLVNNSSNDMLLCGSNWFLLLDQRRYMLWDDTLRRDLTATHASLDPAGGYYITGFNDDRIFYSHYSGQGKRAWLQHYDKSDSLQMINEITSLPQGNLMVAESLPGGLKLKTFSPDGKVISVKELKGNLRVTDVTTKGADTYLLVNNGDLMLIRMSNLSSL